MVCRMEFWNGYHQVKENEVDLQYKWKTHVQDTNLKEGDWIDRQENIKKISRN